MTLFAIYYLQFSFNAKLRLSASTPSTIPKLSMAVLQHFSAFLLAREAKVIEIYTRKVFLRKGKKFRRKTIKKVPSFIVCENWE